MSKYTITPSRHTKKGIDIWLIKPTDRLDSSAFRDVERKIKQIGGYYSRFTHSFVMETKPDEAKLNEVFGETVGIESIAKNAGVSQSKVAMIQVGVKGYSRVDKRTLRNEYNAKKLLVSRWQYFDGMYDTTRTIPDNERSWSDHDSNFEREFTYSSSPYISGNEIRFGDYVAKYKDDIIIPKQDVQVQAKSFDYYVFLDKDDKVNNDDEYKLDRIDSDRGDIEVGSRVVTAMYGNKYCGEVTKKDKSVFTIRNYSSGTSEEQISWRYTVKLDNGVTQSLSTFKLDTENECNEVVVPAIFMEGSFIMPENFWSTKIVREIGYIKSRRQTKAQRKKAEYIEQDEKAIKTMEFRLFESMKSWLGWELEYKDYARKITGETEEQQNSRIEKWQSEYNITTEKPKAVGEVKTTEDIDKEKKELAAKKKQEAIDHIEKNGLTFPDEKIKQGYIMLYPFKGDNEKLAKLFSRVADFISGQMSIFTRAEERKEIKQKYIKLLIGKDIAKSNATDQYFQDVVTDWFIENTDLYQKGLISAENEIEIEEFLQPKDSDIEQYHKQYAEYFGSRVGLRPKNAKLVALNSKLSESTRKFAKVGDGVYSTMGEITGNEKVDIKDKMNIIGSVKKDNDRLMGGDDVILRTGYIAGGYSGRAVLDKVLPIYNRVYDSIKNKKDIIDKLNELKTLIL